VSSEGEQNFEPFMEIFQELLDRLQGGVIAKSEAGKSGEEFGALLTAAVLEGYDLSSMDELPSDSLGKFAPIYNQIISQISPDGDTFEEFVEREFIRTKSPVFAWMAVLVSLNDSNLPVWVQKYLSGVGAKMMLTGYKVKSMNTNAYRAEICEAIGARDKGQFKPFVDNRVKADAVWKTEENREKAKGDGLRGNNPDQDTAQDYGKKSGRTMRSWKKEVNNKG